MARARNLTPAPKTGYSLRYPPLPFNPSLPQTLAGVVAPLALEHSLTPYVGDATSQNLNNHWMTETHIYDSRLRLIVLKDTSAYLPERRIPVEYDFTQSFAPNGDVLSSTDTMNGSWTFTYDDFNRLLSATDTTSGAAYTDIYDRYGNRWNQYLGGVCTAGASFCVTFDTSNHVSNGSLTYDAAGNVTADSQHHYAFDAENRLVSVDAGVTAVYIYDAHGNRVRKTTPVGSLDYLYDLANRPFVEVTVPASGVGTWDRSEVFAGTRHLATYTGGPTGATYNNFSDGLGTERMRTTYAGVICETITNLPFGDGQTTTGTCGDPSPLHFTGKERDLESGLDNFGARYNASSLGRFMSADPKIPNLKHLVNPQRWNKYVYTLNNPLRFVDPDGLQEMEVQVRAFIPQPTALGFKGDNRGFTTAQDVSSRTAITIRVETDPAKSQNPLLNVPKGVAGQTVFTPTGRNCPRFS